MNERIAKAGLLTIACAVLVLTGFVLTSSLEAFEPCRVLYRLPQAVRDSLACRVHSAIGLAALLFLAITAASAAVTGVLVFIGRGAVRSDNHHP